MLRYSYYRRVGRDSIQVERWLAPVQILDLGRPEMGQLKNLSGCGNHVVRTR
jgi:hypothetical protein